MINDNVPYKLKEIIMDTWPQLYWLKKEEENETGTIGTGRTHYERTNDF